MEKSLHLVIIFVLVQSMSVGSLYCGDPYYTEQLHSPPTVSMAFIKRCIEVKNTFEDALLKNTVNLHILQKTFISSSHPSPQLLNVIYQIESDDSIAAVWSSSHVFTVINPQTLHELQSGIMIAVFFLEGIIFPENIVLYLNFCNDTFTKEETDYGIITITEKLKAYAIHQDKFSSWDGNDKGYVILNTLPQAIASTILIPLATLVMVVFGIALSWLQVVKLSTLDEGYDTQVKISFFWSFIMVIIFTNAYDIAFGVAFSITSSSNSLCTVIKFIMAIVIAVLGVIVGWRTNEKNLLNDSTSPEPHHCCTKKIDYSCAFCNIFLFAYIVGISIVSTTALAVVHPVLVLSTVTYIATSLFSIVSIMMTISKSIRVPFNRFTTHQDVKKRRLYLCRRMIYILAMIVFCLITLLYLPILSKEDSTYYYSSGIVNSISSFLPSIIVAMVGYFAKKMFTAKERRKFKEQLSTDEESVYSSLECTKKIEMIPLQLVGEERESACPSSDNEDESAKLLLKTEEAKL